MTGSAVLSADGAYRYRLERAWAGGPALAWVMLNPSTADATTDDRTLLKVQSFTRRAGYGALVVVNLYALRATDPAELELHPDPVGPENLPHVAAVLAAAPAVVAAWGAHKMGRGSVLRLRLRDLVPAAVPVLALGTAKAGAPLHPCRLSPAYQLGPFTLP